MLTLLILRSVGYSMANAISHRAVTVETWVCTQVDPCGIVADKSGTGTGFCPSSLVFPVKIIPQWLFILIYHLGCEKYARWWPQFREIVSLH
jgi:hypothetical protein